MEEDEAPPRVPRGVLIAAACIIAGTITFAAVARWTGYGASRVPESTPVASADLRFEDRPDGAIAVIRAGDGNVIAMVPPGQDGFIRVIMRNMAQERMARTADQMTPFRLVRWADSRLSIEDLATGRKLELASFGPTNTEAFAKLLSPPSSAR